MQLHSSTLELRVIRTLTHTKSQKVSARLFAGLRDGCFHTSSGRESYSRIKVMLQQRGELLTWQELTVDPVISETVRRKLTAKKLKPLPPEKIDTAIRLLHKYRRMREMVYMAQHIIKEVEKESVDDEKLLDDCSERVVKARMSGETNNWFTHIGGDDKKDIDVFKQAMNPELQRFLPTGFKTFDNRNRGLPRGREFIFASNSGGGKSMLARQLAENIAKQGGRVCLVPLEMDDVETMQRNIASISKVSMSKVIDPKLFSRDERKELYTDFLRFRKKIKKAGGLMSLFTPQEDMTGEEILFALKAFGYHMVIIDYIGLLKGVDGDDQWKALQKVTRFGHRFAVLNNTSVGFCVQLTEEGLLAASRGMKRDASNLWRWTCGPREKETGFVMIEQDKARQQVAFPFPLFFDWEHQSVRDLTDDEVQDRAKEKEERKKNSGNNQKYPNSRKKDDKAKHFSKKEKPSDRDEEKGKKAKGDEYFDLD